MKASELRKIAENARKRIQDEERRKKYAEEDAAREANILKIEKYKVELPPRLEGYIKSAAERGENSYFYVWLEDGNNYWPPAEIVEFFRELYPDLKISTSTTVEEICTNYELGDYANHAYRGILFKW